MRYAAGYILVTSPCKPLRGPLPRFRTLKAPMERPPSLWKAQLDSQGSRGFELFREDLLRMSRWFQKGKKKVKSGGDAWELRSKIGRASVRRSLQIQGMVERGWESVEVRLENLQLMWLQLFGQIVLRVDRLLRLGHGQWRILKSFHWQLLQSARGSLLLPHRDPERKNLSRAMRGSSEDALILTVETLWKGGQFMLKALVLSGSFITRQLKAIRKALAMPAGELDGKRILPDTASTQQEAKSGPGYLPVASRNKKAYVYAADSAGTTAPTRPLQRAVKMTRAKAPFVPLRKLHLAGWSREAAINTAKAAVAALSASLALSFAGSFDILLTLSAVFGITYATGKARRRLPLTPSSSFTREVRKSESIRRIDNVMQAIENLRYNRLAIKPKRLPRGLHVVKTPNRQIDKLGVSRGSSYSNRDFTASKTAYEINANEVKAHELQTIDAEVSAVERCEPGIFSLPIIGGLLNTLDSVAFRLESLFDRISRRVIIGLSLTSHRASRNWEIQRSLQQQTNAMRGSYE